MEVVGRVGWLKLLLTKSLSIESYFAPSGAVVSQVVSLVRSLLSVGSGCLYMRVAVIIPSLWYPFGCWTPVGDKLCSAFFRRLARRRRNTVFCLVQTHSAHSFPVDLAVQRLITVPSTEQKPSSSQNIRRYRVRAHVQRSVSHQNGAASPQNGFV